MRSSSRASGVRLRTLQRLRSKRTRSGLYALHRTLLVFLAQDVRRYLPVVRFLAMTGAVFGAMMLAIDCAVGMPLPWTACEGPYVVPLSAVILCLTGAKRFSVAGSALAGTT